MKVSRKFIGLFLIAMLCVVAASLIGWKDISLLFNRSVLTDFFESAAGPRGVIFFLGAHVVANGIGIPGTLLVVVGGAVYGLWWGTVLSVIGATMGAVVAFWLARYLLHGWFNRRFQHRPVFQKMEGLLCDRALSCVLTIRFSPVSPFNVVNFAFGLTSVSVRDYALGTLIGIIPGTLAYTWLGVTGAEALGGGSLVPLMICLLVLMLLSVLPIWLGRVRSPS